MRGIEELNGMFQSWGEAFQQIYGRKLTKKELVEHLTELRKQKERDYIKNQFSTYNVVDIDLTLSLLNTQKIDTVEGTSNKEKQGK